MGRDCFRTPRDRDCPSSTPRPSNGSSGHVGLGCPANVRQGGMAMLWSMRQPQLFWNALLQQVGLYSGPT